MQVHSLKIGKNKHQIRMVVTCEERVNGQNNVLIFPKERIVIKINSIFVRNSQINTTGQ